MAAHAHKVDALMLGVGAAFDYEAGNIRRAPAWMQRHNLEWLYRLLQDPGRLFGRYLSTNHALSVVGGPPALNPPKPPYGGPLRGKEGQDPIFPQFCRRCPQPRLQCAAGLVHHRPGAGYPCSTTRARTGASSSSFWRLRVSRRVLGFNGASGLTRRGWKSELLLCIQNTALLAAALAVALLLTKATMLESRYMYVGVLGLHCIFLYLTHTALKTYLNKYFYKANFATMVGVITTSDRAAPLLRDLKKDWAKKLNGVVLLDAAAPGGKVEGIPVAAVYEGALDWLRREPLDEVYVSVPYQSGDSLRPLLNEMESMGLCVHLNVTCLNPTRLRRDDADGAWFPRLHTQVETAGGVPFVTISAADHDFGAMMIKRLMDVVGALVGLVLSVPIIAVTAIPLKLESPGPLFFKQKRVGAQRPPVLYLQAAQHVHRRRAAQTGADGPKQDAGPDVQDGRRPARDKGRQIHPPYFHRRTAAVLERAARGYEPCRHPPAHGG